MAHIPKRRALVAGASGKLGRHLTRVFKQRGWEVHALCQPTSAPVEHADAFVTCDVRDRASLAGACDGIDTVYSVIGASLSMAPSFRSPGFHAVDYEGNLNLLEVAKESGVNRFGYASVFHNAALAELAYIKAHLDFEEALHDSGMTYSIVRPTGYFSAFDVIPRIARFGIAPLIGDGSARTNPIHEADLAEVCVDALDAGEAVLPVGGPDIFTRQEVFDLAFEMLNKKPRYVQLPPFVMAMNRWMIAPFDMRLSQLLAFFEHVSTTDIVAPPFGTHRLRDYLKKEIVAHEA